MNLKNRNNNMIEFFDRKVEGYDEVHKQFMDTKTMITKSLDENTMKVLDLGVGTGLELIPLFDRFPNAKVTAIDITEKMLNELRKRPFANRVNTICGDFFEVNFGNNYDAVISTSALHHFTEEDKLKLYKKVFECLKENGQFINADKFVNTQEEQENLLQEYIDNPNARPHMDTPLTIDNEIKILKEVGFREIEVEELYNDNYRLVKLRKF